jgi:hypothetical protein
MRILWIGLAMVVPVLVLPARAQTQEEAIAQAADRLARAREEVRVLQWGVVKNAPYSADGVTRTTQVLGDGNRIEQGTTQKLYRDSEGRERREETVLATGALAQADMPHLITISDPVENVSYTLDTSQHTARRINGLAGKSFVYYGVGVSRGGAQEQSAAKEDLGSKNIEGVTAQGTRTTETIPAGQVGNVAPIKIVDEVWYSPDLNMDVLTTHSDPRSGEVVYKLTNVQRGEQPRSLFEVPADYKVITPAAGAGGRGRGAGPVHPITNPQ